MDGVTLQRQARALGDPTRHAIFRTVADAGGEIDIATLTEHFGLNHNAVRQHLAKLVEAGLVRESTVPPGGRGRPKLVYAVDPEADGRWGVVGAFERLAMLLSEIIRRRETPVEVGRRAGRSTAVRAGQDPVDELVRAMAEQGFRPRLERQGPRFTITLGSCPFASTAAADPETVCSLHRGIAEGVAELLDGVDIDGLDVAADPRHGGCALHGTTPVARVAGTAPVAGTAAVGVTA